MTQHDFSGFLIAHAGFRQEFGLLATVAEDNLPYLADLFEDQLAVVLHVLHRHHTDEDEDLWPILRARAPGAVAELDALEAEHERIDPLLAMAADTAAEPAVRAQALRELDRLLGEHLDHEETVALPLIREHLSVAEWAAMGERALASYPKRRVPVIFGWLYSAGDRDLRQAALDTVAPVPRALFRLFWWPSYQRRARKLYGTAIMAHLH